MHPAHSPDALTINNVIPSRSRGPDKRRWSRDLTRSRPCPTVQGQSLARGDGE